MRYDVLKERGRNGEMGSPEGPMLQRHLPGRPQRESKHWGSDLWGLDSFLRERTGRSKKLHRPSYFLTPNSPCRERLGLPRHQEPSPFHDIPPDVP